LSALEHRYRRLLRWYPADHRRRHGEEMLGVLLAAAEPGQERPAPRDTADLLAGAVRVRLRRMLRLPEQDRRDALALAAVTAPLLLMTAMLVQGIMLVRFSPTPEWALYTVSVLLSVPVAVLALRGARRPAAVLAWLLFGAVVAFHAVGIVERPQGIGQMTLVLQVGMPTLLSLVTALLLSAPSDPARGRELIGTPRLSALGFTATLAFGCEASAMLPPAPQILLLAAPMIFAFWAGRAMAAPAGRAAALLLAVPVMTALPSLLPSGANPDGLTWPHFSPHVALAPAALVFAGITAWTLRRSQHGTGAAETA
jgi:hypothetical protein